MKFGKVSEVCLKRSVLRQIKTRREEVVCGAGIGEDCAIFSFSKGESMAVCVQEAAVTTQRNLDREQEEAVRENAGCVQEEAARGNVSQAVSKGAVCPEPFMTMAQLVQKCVNNLAADGAEPAAALIALLLPETAEEAELKELMREAEEKCGELSVEIAGGQTRVSAAVKCPLATVTCLGRLSVEGGYTAKAAMPGQDVVVSKWIGLQGTALLARRYKEKLLVRYPAYFVEEAAAFDRYHSILPEAATAMKSGVCAMRDVSEGGIFGALWELAEGAGVGLTIDMKKLPLRQETVEVCECCNVNPYLLLSGGSLLMTADDGEALVAALAAEQIPAAVVGKVTEGNDRILVNDGEVRYLDKPQSDGIWGGSA